MHRLLFATVFSTVAVAAALASSGTFSRFSPSLSGISADGPRYTTEEEHLVSEIAGSILNIAAFADRFDPGDPFQVRNIGAQPPGTIRFSLARRAEVFTVELHSHVWHPASYVRLARSFMADGADPILTADPYRDRVDPSTVLGAGAEGARLQNVRLSRLLSEHPRSAALHERAALLLASVAGRTPTANRRPLLCRMTAHLAVARALRDTAPAQDGETAERLLQTLADGAQGDRGASADLAVRWTSGPVTFSETPQLSILPPL